MSWVCLGDEWHRFPSHFLLPSAAYRLAFVQSGFRGLLPRPFNLQQVRPSGLPLHKPFQKRKSAVRAGPASATLHATPVRGLCMTAPATAMQRPPQSAACTTGCTGRHRSRAG